MTDQTPDWKLDDGEVNSQNLPPVYSAIRFDAITTYKAKNNQALRFDCLPVIVMIIVFSVGFGLMLITLPLIRYFPIGLLGLSYVVGNGLFIASFIHLDRHGHARLR